MGFRPSPGPHITNATWTWTWSWVWVGPRIFMLFWHLWGGGQVGNCKLSFRKWCVVCSWTPFVRLEIFMLPWGIQGWWVGYSGWIFGPNLMGSLRLTRSLAPEHPANRGSTSKPVALRYTVNIVVRANLPVPKMPTRYVGKTQPQLSPKLR